MGKIVALIYSTLDGVIESPEKWSQSIWTDDHTKYANGLLFNSEAVLLGRDTYDIFAATWPKMEDIEGDMAVRMNTLPKYVASRTLRQADWNNTTIIGSDLEAEVQAIKEAHASDILIYGSGQLTRSLIKLGLLDELKLWVYPAVLGSGKRLFPDGVAPSTWTLGGTTTFNSGAVALDYRLA